MFKPRKPNHLEITELAYRLHQSGCGTETLEEAKSWVKESCVAVFDDYITDGPGYAGKLMMVVWSWPALHQVYIWPGAKLMLVNPECCSGPEEEDQRQHGR